MRGVALLALMTAGFIIFAGIALGVTYTKYDQITTTVTLEDGITCTIEGKEVSSGETIAVNPEFGSMNVHVESATPAVFGYAGKWTSGDDTWKSTGKTDSEATSADFKIDFKHGEFTGSMYICNMGGDYDYKPIAMEFHIEGDEYLKVCIGDTVIHDGDKMTLTGDTSVTISTADGQRHHISYEGWWGNDCEEGSDHFAGLVDSWTCYIYDQFLLDAHGSLHIYYRE